MDLIIDRMGLDQRQQVEFYEYYFYFRKAIFLIQNLSVLEKDDFPHY